jgi:DNA-binding MarR family transcriptional regulator
MPTWPDPIAHRVWRRKTAHRYTCKHRSCHDRNVPRRIKGRIELERFLPYRLSVLTNLVSGAIADVYQQRFNLTIPEWRVVAVLARHPGLSAADVAAHTRMDAVAVSRAVTRLLRAGRIRRSIAAEDRRRSVLCLSVAGAAVYGEIAPIALRYERSLLDGLAAAEIAALDSILDKLTVRAQSIAASARGRKR